jgi:hypothetical protein
MNNFDHLLNWSLKRGSHPFPGPDGGTCINEAALVAAGYPYRPIRAAEQMPDVFSRPICRFAMLLNDHASDSERQHLLPYVTRLACADTPEIERLRAAYIEQQTRGFYVHVPFSRGLEILEGALSIGRQADPLGADDVQTRMDTARASLPPPAEEKELPLFARMKTWFAQKAAEPLG